MNILIFARAFTTWNETMQAKQSGFRAGLLASAMVLAGCGNSEVESTGSRACDTAWYQSIGQRVVTGDGHGHGPDTGSDEWKSVVEFKLGIRGDPAVPDRDSADWCAYVEQYL
jgi:hypothetical protein